MFIYYISIFNLDEACDGLNCDNCVMDPETNIMTCIDSCQDKYDLSTNCTSCIDGYMLKYDHCLSKKHNFFL